MVIVRRQCTQRVLRELVDSIVGIIIPKDTCSNIEVDPRDTLIAGDVQIQQWCERPATPSDVHRRIAIVRTERSGDRSVKAEVCLRNGASKLIATERRGAEKIDMEGDTRVDESRCF